MVLLCDYFAYKIKKPIRYSFLDFSSPGLRKYCCEKEIIVNINKRLTNNIYVEVVPVKEIAGQFFVGNEIGRVIDYAVRMHKMDRTSVTI